MAGLPPDHVTESQEKCNAIFDCNQLFQIINEWSDNCVIMGCECYLTTSEKFVITSELLKGKSVLEISRIIERYH
ncbi:Hypothetical predicted protein [Octopus vulgaris]|uniref:Uncharacterized protein n=1 Tax=Octopus vulgaris TaxID=6645 RepID=A0AA36BCJ7_OCTVU|nr:Hypothetical predicted protein [Octopus vulgaris]